MSSSLPPEFETIVSENHASLRFFIRSLGVTSGWVDDIAQEAFILLLKKWDKLERHDEADSWLRATAKNLVRNELRKTSRRPHLLNKYLTTLVIERDSVTPAPADYAISRENHSALQRCLQTLTAKTRNIVEQRYFHDKNSSEIAEDLEMKSSAVRRALLRAREALATCISREQNKPSKA
ncbi:sigma-70 family RNA polymerase sigma factor [Akkermansiaceae bacterium]|nr:sigma-70 family RNA polymerase sigma factor [Akkermansiaceae bacterium]MDA7929763.1 sigma-70 family RNA polymerase sigma factor [Akkermansiaceae bacterium]MDB4484328.1 sigma-70 family RNA polymerase sigma factor [bacterium]MDB4502046.1 sigma-70 family RNA polymerase sigma factor [Akkermansiaceae bacterium]MDF1710784.1 sigma-70 family RNA polymerase sigma factor [Akkermansiaceae bacterium]